MSCAVPGEIGEALGMPGVGIEEACERIRTLRQTEKSAEFLVLRRKDQGAQGCGTGFAVGGLCDTWARLSVMREIEGDAA